MGKSSQDDIAPVWCPDLVFGRTDLLCCSRAQDVVLLRGSLREWPQFSLEFLYRKGLAAFQRLPLSAFAQLFGYFDWAVSCL